MEQRGFILIADITGFTTYLSGSEIEHARGTLTDLLELLVEHTRSPFVVSALEGDAVMSYAFREGYVSGQTLLESIEDTYVAFRRAIELMVLNNTCRCNACANVSQLDLKFFIHFGAFVVQPVGGFDQLLGSDVNLIHRLLKNTVAADTGIRAYVLCTDPAAQALGLDAAAAKMQRHAETVADFGEVTVNVKDMHPIYEARKELERIEFGEDEVLGVLTTDIALPRELVWDYLISPEWRSVLLGSDRQEVVDRREGRIGNGSIYQCYHGDKVVTHLVLEWIPFERVIFKQRVPMRLGTMSNIVDYRLTDTDRGTRLEQTLIVPGIKAPIRGLARAVTQLIGRKPQKHMDDFRERIEKDAATRQTGPGAAVFAVADFKAAAAASLTEPPGS